MMEVWKDVKGFRGKYQVSNAGNVKSLTRKVKKWNGFRTVNECILKPDKDRSGYLRVRLQNKIHSKRIFIHRLVFETFNSKILKGRQINHINSIKNDNNICNLESVTPRENKYHSLNIKGNNKQGIHRLKGTNSYQVKIYFKGVHHYLGTFKTEKKAKDVYNNFNNINQIKNKYLCHTKQQESSK